MSEFGQLLPATPQIYWTQAQFSFTKTGLTSHMCRALKTVGMVPLTHWWPYDALNSANAEIVLTQGVNATSTYIFPFDFPDSSTFQINNELWRPYIAVVAYYGNVNSAASSSQHSDYFRVDLGLRRDGATTMTGQVFGRWIATNGNQFGWGNQGDAVNLTTALTGSGYMSRGMFIFKPDWKPWASAAFTDNSLLSVRNFFVYLGPAGLFVYLGTGTTKDLFGSLMAAGFGFGGARLPGRSSASDTNLNRINPIVHLPMQETETEIWNAGTGALRCMIHGMQHDLTSTTAFVFGDLWNLENSEVPFYPDRRPNTVPSPRKLSSGQGAHILGRVVVIPKEQVLSTTTLMGPVNPRIVTNDTRPTYGEVFACPNLRFADITAPLGDYQDPDTLTNWRIVPHPAANFQLALYSENVNVMSTLQFGTRTLVDITTYDLTSITQTGTGAFPVATPVTITSSPAGFNASANHVTISVNVGTSRWTSPASQDLLTLDMTAFINNDSLDLNWSMTPPIANAADSIYEVQFDIRVRGGAEDTNNFQLIQLLNGTATNVPVTEGLNTRTTIATAGANTGHYAYDYKTYVGSVTRDVSQAGGPIVLRWRATRTNASDATVFEIKSIRLNRYRYV